MYYFTWTGSRVGEILGLVAAILIFIIVVLVICAAYFRWKKCRNSQGNTYHASIIVCSSSCTLIHRTSCESASLIDDLCWLLAGNEDEAGNATYGIACQTEKDGVHRQQDPQQQQGERHDVGQKGDIVRRRLPKVSDVNLD